MASAARHGSVSAFDVDAGFGDGVPVLASNIGVLPDVVSVGSGVFCQGSVVIEGGALM